jgi:hypothetical protein
MEILLLRRLSVDGISVIVVLPRTACGNVNVWVFPTEENTTPAKFRISRNAIITVFPVVRNAIVAVFLSRYKCYSYGISRRMEKL